MCEIEEEREREGDIEIERDRGRVREWSTEKGRMKVTKEDICEMRTEQNLIVL